jgi:hypothetical protein
MKTIHKVTSNFKVSPASLQTFIDFLAADRQGRRDTRLTLTPSVIPNYKYVIMVSDLKYSKYFSCFLYCYHQMHINVFITLYLLYFTSCTLQHQ